MKTLKIRLSILLAALVTLTGFAQEKRIQFEKGTLKICSNRNFNISGYEGTEVIVTTTNKGKVKGYELKVNKEAMSRISEHSLATKREDSSKTSNFILYEDIDSKKYGLKEIGANTEVNELSSKFKIEVQNNVLTLKDVIPNSSNSLILYGSESYEIKIPNSVKLIWTSENCASKKSSGNRFFYDSKPSTLSSFNGEVEIQTTLNNIELTDVSGVVAINSVGGNVTVKFDKEKPENLYSIYSNNGFIDMQIPENSNLQLDVTGKKVYSDVDFKILEEKVFNDFGHDKNKMVLQKGAGKVKIKLDAGYGNVYLRKK